MQFIHLTGRVYQNYISHHGAYSRTSPIFLEISKKEVCPPPQEGTLTHLAIRGLDLSSYGRKYNVHEYLSRAPCAKQFIFFSGPSLFNISFPPFTGICDIYERIRVRRPKVSPRAKIGTNS